MRKVSYKNDSWYEKDRQRMEEGRRKRMNAWKKESQGGLRFAKWQKMGKIIVCCFMTLEPVGDDPGIFRIHGRKSTRRRDEYAFDQKRTDVNHQ